MWKITDTMNRETTIESLKAKYPELVAYDESAWRVRLSEFEDPEGLADSGMSTRDERRIIFWPDAESSIDDDGGNAIADARWIE